MATKFCRVCGEELVKREIFWFDESTGERNFEMKCPSGICSHPGNYHDFETVGGGFLRRSKLKCKKCDEINDEQR